MSHKWFSNNNTFRYYSSTDFHRVRSIRVYTIHTCIKARTPYYTPIGHRADTRFSCLLARTTEASAYAILSCHEFRSPARWPTVKSMFDRPNPTKVLFAVNCFCVRAYARTPAEQRLRFRELYSWACVKLQYTESTRQPKAENRTTFAGQRWFEKTGGSR